MNRKIPSLAALRVLVSAARHQNFRRAADELALTESAVSRQIASLESQIGVSLFSRHKRRVRLTQTGEAYAGQVAQTLALLEGHTLDAMARSTSGAALELASLPTLAAEWLIPRLPSFLQRHPDVTVNIATRSEMFLFEGTSFDAAIHCGKPDWPGAQCSHMFAEESIPVCHPQFLKRRRHLKPDQLAQLPLLHLSTRRSDWQHWFDAQAVPSVNAMRGPSFEQHTLLISAARAKLGMALLPRFLAVKYLNDGSLVCPCDLSLQGRAYYFIHPESKPASLPVMLFRDWLLQEARSFSMA